MTPTHRSDPMTDKLRDAIAALQADDAPTERECGYQDAIDEVLRILDARAALAAAPQPAPTHECPVCEETVTWTRPGSPYCGECAADNGRDVRMRSIGTAPQPVPADRKALVEAIREANDDWIASQSKPSSRPEVIADALLARGLRLPGGETMAWAVVGEDGKMVGINYDRMTAQHLCNPGERVVRVAIRKLDE